MRAIVSKCRSVWGWESQYEGKLPGNAIHPSRVKAQFLLRFVVAAEVEDHGPAGAATHKTQLWDDSQSLI
jgi:hypothetical protein